MELYGFSGWYQTLERETGKAICMLTLPMRKMKLMNEILLIGIISLASISGAAGPDKVASIMPAQKPPLSR